MNSVVKTEEMEDSFRALFESCRDTCLWFWSTKGLPIDFAGRLEVLRQIELHGTREQFVQARRIRKWL